MPEKSNPAIAMSDPVPGVPTRTARDRKSARASPRDGTSAQDANAPRGESQAAKPDMVKKRRAPPTPGRGRGRPSSVGGTPRNIRLTDEQAKLAFALGDKNLNRGVRTALDSLALISQTMDHPHLQADIAFITKLGRGSSQRGLLSCIRAARTMNDLGDLELIDDDLQQLSAMGSGSVVHGMRLGMRAVRILGPGLSLAAAQDAISTEELASFERIGNGDLLAGLRLCLDATLTLGPDVARKLARGN